MLGVGCVGGGSSVVPCGDSDTTSKRVAVHDVVRARRGGRRVEAVAGGDRLPSYGEEEGPTETGDGSRFGGLARGVKMNLWDKIRCDQTCAAS